MNILYVCTVGSTMGFFKTYIKELISEGHRVDIACNNTEKSHVPELFYEIGCNVYSISTSRSPLKLGNIKAIGQIKKLVKENGYDIVHCHTPVAAMCTRIACKGLRKKGLKVFYTAHGFHFYEGAPKKNWMLYYPIEKLCARYTDVLITINKEDFALAKKKMKAKQVLYVPGVGIDFERFNTTVVDNDRVRESLGLRDDNVMILSAGMVNKNKNHRLVIRALALLNNPKLHYFVAGVGEETDNNMAIAKELGVQDNVHFLGYRNDMPQLDMCADVFVFPSIREGLGLAAIEAMATGTPCLGMNTRGIKEYIIEGETGFLFDNNPESCKNALVKYFKLPEEKKKEMSLNCIEKSKSYDYSNTNNVLWRIYNECK